ncbi:1,4-dihydroxy-2-naphthoate octaprenyltransferase [Nonlabens sp.]|uniref:1,4-dihydroxy-2-naphthoate octaprenyltransferase n=1 Tax=Nonlabens sp. TaxID=1888209 RepID=UPI001BD12457|nr:1,4-dihydroxy-2-naphthoate octaprenyltransferase [Nonlabens sp.]
MAEASKLKAWISAARLRTLPLSISGILAGSAYAYWGLYQGTLAKSILENIQKEKGYHQLSNNLRNELSEVLDVYLIDFNYFIPILALITTLGFQILSNFANDYGDGVKGTDNEDRIGPMRAIQSGIISPQEMKRGMVITAILTLISAVLLIYVSLGMDRLLISLFFLALGIAAIWAAINYTVGDNAYGYRGLGDVFVFVFFGPVSVMGSYYLITKTSNWEMIFPSITIGLLSVAVLNLNNMRDMESDKKAGKNTIVVKLGLAKAKWLHYAMILIAFLSALRITGNLQHAQLVLFKISSIKELNYIAFLPLLAFIPLIMHVFKVKKTSAPALLDPELKKVALSTFLFAVLCVISIWMLS